MERLVQALNFSGRWKTSDGRVVEVSRNTGERARQWPWCDASGTLWDAFGNCAADQGLDLDERIGWRQK